MQLEILTPEGPLFQSEQVQSVTIPSVEGSFQILKNHIPILALLETGVIKIKGSATKPDAEIFEKNNETDELLLKIKSGVLENKENKAVLLVQV